MDFGTFPVKGNRGRAITATPQLDVQQLHDALRLLFEQGALAVSWTQYTPSFNDGEPCVFGCTEPEVRLDNLADDDDAYGYGEAGPGFLSLYEFESFNRGFDNEQAVSFATKPGVESALETLRHVAEGSFHQALNETFGDGVRVTAYPDRIELEEFDCGY